uniref:Uncharacterized protein n=1 Tax=Mola mola TaxID=94237 RepID=A0A3Q4AQC5_MOLML
MKSQKILSACLLLWFCKRSVFYVPFSFIEIQVKYVMDGIMLVCPKESQIIKDGRIYNNSLKLEYKDESSGEYICQDEKNTKIFVKIRTCDNCVELDLASVIGIAAGNVVATIVIAVGVYLTTAQTRFGSSTSHKKGSDRQRLVPNEVSNRAPNDHYQPLKLKSGQKDTYDVLTNRR